MKGCGRPPEVLIALPVPLWTAAELCVMPKKGKREEWPIYQKRVMIQKLLWP